MEDGFELGWDIRNFKNLGSNLVLIVLLTKRQEFRLSIGGGGGGGHMRVVGLFHELIRPRGERARMFFKKQNTGTI